MSDSGVSTRCDQYIFSVTFDYSVLRSVLAKSCKPRTFWCNAKEKPHFDIIAPWSHPHHVICKDTPIVQLLEHRIPSFHVGIRTEPSYPSLWDVFLTNCHSAHVLHMITGQS